MRDPSVEAWVRSAPSARSDPSAQHISPLLTQALPALNKRHPDAVDRARRFTAKPEPHAGTDRDHGRYPTLLLLPTQLPLLDADASAGVANDDHMGCVSPPPLPSATPSEQSATSSFAVLTQRTFMTDAIPGALLAVLLPSHPPAASAQATPTLPGRAAGPDGGHLLLALWTAEHRR